MRLSRCSSIILCTGRVAGVVSDERWAIFNRTRDEMGRIMQLMKGLALSPQGWEKHGFDVRRDGVMRRYIA